MGKGGGVELLFCSVLANSSFAVFATLQLKANFKKQLSTFLIFHGNLLKLIRGGKGRGGEGVVIILTYRPI